MGYLIFVFFIFVFGLLFINVDTRRAIYFIQFGLYFSIYVLKI
ncbi:hypothetical protein ACVXZZ_00045 [Staphylococcus aureus]